MTTTLDWYGCATFRLRTDDLTIMLDAYVDRPSNAAGPEPRLTADDIDDADWILVGHAHFDHLWGAERILANTDATLIAGYESVRVMERAGAAIDRMIAVAGGETIALETPDGRGVGARVTVFPSQHSCVWSQVPESGSADDDDADSGEMAQPDEVCLGDLGVTWQEQQERMSRLMGYLSSLEPVAVEHIGASMVGHSERGDGGALVFLLELPDGTVLFQDTSGHWEGVFGRLSADVAILAAAGRANIDGEPIQGSLAEFIGRQAAMVDAHTVVLGHHDNWLPGFSVPTDVAPIRSAIADAAPDATLLDLDYLDATPILPIT